MNILNTFTCTSFYFGYVSFKHSSTTNCMPFNLFTVPVILPFFIFVIYDFIRCLRINKNDVSRIKDLSKHKAKKSSKYLFGRFAEYFPNFWSVCQFQSILQLHDTENTFFFTRTIWCAKKIHLSCA